MANKVFIATSLDGYIADKNGGIDWLNDYGDPNDQSLFNDFMDSIDALIMGRNTYEKVLSFDIDWPYTKKVFVLSNSLKTLPEKLEGKVELISGELSTVVQTLKKEGFSNLYIDGGATIQSFLRLDMIDELILTRVPILLGGGVSLFADLSNFKKFIHNRTTSDKTGLVTSFYEVVR